MVNEEHVFGFGLLCLGFHFCGYLFVCVFFFISLILCVEHLPLAVPLNITLSLRASLGNLQPLNLVSNMQPLTADAC